MTDKPRKLSDTAPALLTTASGRANHLIALPRLPAPGAHRARRQAGGKCWIVFDKPAQALPNAWDARTSSNHAAVDCLIDPIAGLRTALSSAASVSTSIDGARLRKDTKQAQGLDHAAA